MFGVVDVVIVLVGGFLLGGSVFYAIFAPRIQHGALLRQLEQREEELKAQQQVLAEVQQQLEDLQQAREQFQAKVDDHFVDTASLINQMTQSYKAVYDHLEKGAVSLVTKETLQKRLGNGQSLPVRLEAIGSSAHEAPSYRVVVPQELPGNVLEELSKLLEVSTDELRKRLPGVLAETLEADVAKEIEYRLKQQGIAVVLRPV